MNIKAIVTDIEGTTSSIAFVHDVLFPYASQRLAAFVHEHQNDKNVAQLLQDTRNEAGEPDADTERAIAILLQWIAEDSKVTPLKALQGLIWEQGFKNGDFTGHIYQDAVRNLQLWQQSGIDIYVYSSGSVYAQQLLFGHSDAGNLLPLFKGYFDTGIGHKRDVNSYLAIAESTGLPAEQILFLSDTVEELDAARDAGMQTIQLLRDDDTGTGSHVIAHDFDQIVL
ncbi:MAG: acireductone synthase [Gammaproteobacteria bacterium]|jgi:enolase-phosphatase E1